MHIIENHKPPFLPSKQARLEARISKKQKELFQYAADLQGRSLTDFMIKSLQDAARQAIKEKDVLELSLRDRKIFVDAFLNAPAPSAKLLKAAQRYKDQFTRER